MALSVESANRVWQKANSALNFANPAIQEAFLKVKQYLASQKKNPDLQILFFSEADADAAGGTVLLSGACKLYAAYIKKENSATDNWAWIYNDATNDGTAADAMVVFPLLIANDEQCYFNPAGLDMDTGVVVTQYATDPLGASDGSNGGSGFVIVGNP